MHGAPKCLRAWPFRTEDASFTIVMAPTVQVSRVLLGLCIIIFWVVP
jgi:hypothetical protein